MCTVERGSCATLVNPICRGRQEEEVRHQAQVGLGLTPGLFLGASTLRQQPPAQPNALLLQPPAFNDILLLTTSLPKPPLRLSDSYFRSHLGQSIFLLL